MKVKEGLRRARLGDLRKLYRDRYGIELPDADDGREDLHELLLVASLAYNPERAMISEIAQWTPWMDKAEAEQAIDAVNRTPMFLRFRSARELGDIQRLSDHDRGVLGITTIKPFDVTDEELKKRRKAKDALRRWRERKAKGQKPREAWLANCKSRVKPWGHPSKRRTWYRKRARKLAQVLGTGVSAAKFNTAQDRPVSVESLKKGKSRKRVAVRKAG